MAQQEPPWRESASSTAASPPFEELLSQLREAHAREVQELHDENAVLSSRLLVAGQGCYGGAKQQPEDTALPPRPGDTPIHCDSATVHWDTTTVGDSSAKELKPRLQLSHTYSSTQSVAEPRRQRSWLRRRQANQGSAPSFVFEDIAPRTINLQVLCVEKYPEEQWADLSVKQKVELLREALKPKHSLIDPHSVFMRWWDVLLALALLQVGLFTPYEVVFVDDLVIWQLFALNRFIDLIFLVDMVIQFFLLAEVKRSRRGGTMLVRDPWTLRRRYLTTWFLIDVVSMIPFDIINMVSSGPVLQRAQMMRGVRFLRLAKLLRMLRSSKMIRRWRNGIGITFAAQKLIQFVIILVFVSHWMACIWGFTGLILGTDLCDAQGRPTGASPGIDQVSWVTTLYLGGKISPDSPCSPFTVYAASLHWSIMTLTSIGYGDIVPVRVEEYMVCTLCMLLGGMLWAYIIGCLCSITSNRSLAQQKFEANTDLLNLAMNEAHVPRKERPKYREFLREARAHDRSVHFCQIARSFSPLLRQELMFFVTKHVIRAVSYFRDATVPRMLLTSIASGLSPKFFSRGEPLDSLRDDLCLVDRGTVAHNEKVMMAPSVLNEDFIILQKYKRPATTTSLTYTQVLAFTRASLEELLLQHPVFARTLRVRAAKMAFCCALLTIREVYLEGFVGAELSLCDAFDAVFGEEEDTTSPWRARSPRGHSRGPSFVSLLRT